MTKFAIEATWGL